MERKELKWTKVKLILIFTFMMFLVVLVLWYSYFFYKYLTEKNLDNNIFYDFMDSFSSGKIRFFIFKKMVKQIQNIKNLIKI